MEHSPQDEQIEAFKRQIAELQAKLEAAEKAKAPVVFQETVKAERDVVAGDKTTHNYYLQGEPPDPAESIITAYLDALSKDLAGLKLGEIDTSPDTSRKQPLQLADVYVPLNTTRFIPEDASLLEGRIRLSSEHGSLRGDVDVKGEMRPVSALEALANHRTLTLLGKPGSGKSTFGSSVLLALAQARLGHDEAIKRLGEGWNHGLLLPVRITLRRFAASLPPGKEPARAADLWGSIGAELQASHPLLAATTMDEVRRIASTTGALILLDGLDECGNADKRERVMAAVNELIGHAGDKCRFVLTARPYAWPAGADPSLGVYQLADLEPSQIEQFITAWYAASAKQHWFSPGDADAKRDDLLASWQRPGLRELAGNPLLLTLMTTLHSNTTRLPEDRADLYDQSVDLLMQRWNRRIGAEKALLETLEKPTLTLAHLRGVVEKLAFESHKDNVGAEGAADIGEGKLRRAFSTLLDGSHDKAGVVVRYIEERAGLLLGLGEKEMDGEPQFSFPHRTFQEYLAACHLAGMEQFAMNCRGLARTNPAHWQVVLPLAARIAKAERGTGAADGLVGRVSVEQFRKTHQPELADWHCAKLAGAMLQEIGPTGEDAQAIRQRVTGWLAAALPVHPDQGGLPAPLRAQCGDSLAALGDSRFDSARLFLPAEDDFGFVRIPADPAFCIGTRGQDRYKVSQAIGSNADEYEINDENTPTREFYIARYPVTVAQFRAFVEATGFKLGDEDALRDPDSRPVRYVSWYEAMEYCDWLNDALIKSPLAPTIRQAQDRLLQRGESTASRAATPCRQPDAPVHSRHGDADLPSGGLLPLIQSGKWHITLPSELEWEKAARAGLVGTVFPWDDTPDPNRANYGETNIGDTSPVGCFPPNAYGLYDMVGNVWEWTRSLWGKDFFETEFGYPYQPDDSKREDLRAGDEILRVVRGGSWSDDQVNSRCAVRLRYPPDSRNYYHHFGFRVVVVLCSPPVV